MAGVRVRVSYSKCKFSGPTSGLGVRSSGDRTQQLQLQTTGLEKPARGAGQRDGPRTNKAEQASHRQHRASGGLGGNTHGNAGGGGRKGAGRTAAGPSHFPRQLPAHPRRMSQLAWLRDRAPWQNEDLSHASGRLSLRMRGLSHAGVGWDHVLLWAPQVRPSRTVGPVCTRTRMCTHAGVEPVQEAEACSLRDTLASRASLFTFF